jgi:hypothetical protein
MQNEDPGRRLASVRQVMDRFRTSTSETREMWTRARHAILEAERIRARVKAQVRELCDDEGFRTRYRDAMLAKILDSAIAETSADKGNIQLFDPKSRTLQIRIQRGFQAPFLNYFNAVEHGQAVCGTAMKACTRIVVEDTTNSPIFRKSPSLEMLLDADVRAVQSTPLLGHNGKVVGMLSTHWGQPRQPTPQDLQVLDHWACEAAALVEWRDRGSRDALPEKTRLFLFRPERAGRSRRRSV